MQLKARNVEQVQLTASSYDRFTINSNKINLDHFIKVFMIGELSGAYVRKVITLSL